MLGTVHLPQHIFLSLNKHYSIKQHVSPPAANTLSEETFQTSNFLLNLISSHTVLITYRSQLKITVVSKANAEKKKKEKNSRCFL